MSSRAEQWLVELVADRARRALDCATMLVIVEHGGELEVAASSPPQSASARGLAIEGSALGGLYRRGGPISVEQPSVARAAWFAELDLEPGAALMQPLPIEPQGGMMLAVRHEGSFTAADARTLNSLASDLAMHLMAERTAEAERLRYGARSREHDRERWAHELHDEALQGLGLLRMRLAHAKELEDPQQLDAAVEAAVRGLEEELMGIRHLITELRPPALDDLGLGAAIEALARRAKAVYGLEVKTQIELERLGEQRRLDPELETTVYRVVQEGVDNVARHARATRAVVSVNIEHDLLIATVVDQGRGIPDTESASQGHTGRRNGHTGSESATPVGGFGVPGMRERAALVGGTLELVSAPGKGTTLRLTVPLPERRSV